MRLQGRGQTAIRPVARLLAAAAVVLPLAAACGGPPPVTRSLRAATCRPAPAASAPALSQVRTAMVHVPGHPFGVVVTADGRWAFVSLGSTVEVLRIGTSLAPALVRAIPVPQPLGEALTPDGRYLLVASRTGAVVIGTARAEQGRPGAVLGTLSDPGGGQGAIGVTVSPGGGYAFVTQEDAGQAAVFRLGQALARGFGPADLVGHIPLGIAPVGLAVSPDGRWLYATSEAAAGGRPGQDGTLTLISVPRAEADPARSVVTTVAAGCSPVRVITSADGREVWVTARGSNDLLGFSAAALRSDPARALTATVRVGQAPVGLALVRHGTLLVVADSNRFDQPGARSDLTVVSVAAALAGRPALTGRVTAGGFPRQMALVPGGAALLVTNFDSGQLEAVSVPTIP